LPLLAEACAKKKGENSTSIMAVQFDGGVVIGADSRTTTGRWGVPAAGRNAEWLFFFLWGSYVANRTSDKLTPVHDRIYCCRSGSAADTQQIAEYVRYYLEMHAVELGSLPQVLTAATLFRKLCYENKNRLQVPKLFLLFACFLTRVVLQAGIICGGWDPIEGGQVFSITMGGSMVKQPFALGGSGSTYIYGYCDANYRSGMTKDEASDASGRCIFFFKFFSLAPTVFDFCAQLAGAGHVAGRLVGGSDSDGGAGQGRSAPLHGARQRSPALL
jgi:20S proteasome subunit beta 1